jgi:hypothetical protein
VIPRIETIGFVSGGGTDLLGMHLLQRNGINGQNKQIDGTRSANPIIQKPGGHVKRRKQGFSKGVWRVVNTRFDPVFSTGSKEGD